MNHNYSLLKLFQCKEICNHAYFGRLDYNGLQSPHLINSTWFHDAGEDDITQGLEYTEDSQLVLVDVCNRNYENTKIYTTTKKQKKVTENEKIMKDLVKKQKVIEELNLSRRKKNVFQTSNQVFAELKTKELNDYQKEG